MYLDANIIYSYLDTNLDTSAKNLDTFWILLGAFSDTWPPLHVATKLLAGCELAHYLVTSKGFLSAVRMARRASCRYRLIDYRVR